jgi:hypothetical protein
MDLYLAIHVVHITMCMVLYSIVPIYEARDSRGRNRMEI